jgi:hypothetical protein
MKKLIALLAGFAVLASAPSALAFSDIAITAGATTTDTTPKSDSIDASGGTGFFAGVHGFMEMSPQFYLRAGAVVSNRMVSYASDGVDGDLEYNIMNLEAPITAMYMFNDMIGAFGGARLNLNLNSSCSETGDQDCDALDFAINTIGYGAEIGGHFRFTPNFGVEAAYVIGLSEFGEFDLTQNAGVAYSSSLLINGFFIF